MSEEADALNDMADEAEEHFREQVEGELYHARQQTLDSLRARKRDARRAEIGSTIRCAQCEKLIVKKRYHQVFCSNAKTHGRANCKDRYHNRIQGLTLYLQEHKG